MRGAHRGPAGASAGKNARWLAVLAVLVISVPAAVAGLIWFFRSGTDLAWSVALLIPAVIQLVQSLARGDADMVWLSASGVLLFGWRIASEVTHIPDGGLVGFLVDAVVLVSFGYGTVLLARDLGLGRVWRSLRARLASGPGDDGPAGPS
jgi:hypothetical protein